MTLSILLMFALLAPAMAQAEAFVPPVVLTQGMWAENSERGVPFLTMRRIQRERPGRTERVALDLERAGVYTVHHSFLRSRHRETRVSRAYRPLRRTAEAMARDPLLRAHANPLRHAAVRALYFVSLLEREYPLTDPVGNQAAIFFLMAGLTTGVESGRFDDRAKLPRGDMSYNHGHVGQLLARRFAVVIRTLPNPAARYRLTRALAELLVWDQLRDGYLPAPGAAALHHTPARPSGDVALDDARLGELAAAQGMGTLLLPAGFPEVSHGPQAAERTFLALYFAATFDLAAHVGTVVCAGLTSTGGLLLQYTQSDGHPQEEVMRQCLSENPADGHGCLARLSCNRLDAPSAPVSEVLPSNFWNVTFRW